MTAVFIGIGIKLKPLNCDGCTACCHGDAIFLHEDEGDDPKRYFTVKIDHPKHRYMLDHKPNGDCIYVTDKGCGIYKGRPVICRTLDCRAVVKKIGYTRYRKMVKEGLLHKGMFDAAMRRMK